MSKLELENLPLTLQGLRTRPLFVMQLVVGPIIAVGATPGVNRRIGIVHGGEFVGERLRGTVMDGGSDWQAARSDGSTTLDVRIVLKTDDDALITMVYTGMRHGTPEAMRRLGAGEAVDPATYYFRTMASFETAAPRYEFLNRVLAVGVGDRQAGGPVYSLFEVL